MSGGLSSQKDAFGHQLQDYLGGAPALGVYEVDDGFVEPAQPPSRYFSEYRHWPTAEKTALRSARGRILDIGCGAGRVALYLQEKGFYVLGVDVSPLAVKVCRARGLKNARAMSVTQVSPALGTFDTIILFGNNFSLAGNPKRGRWLFRRFHRMTSGDAVILAQSVDPYQTKVPRHFAYQRRNRRRGRMPGQIRLRIRYKTYATPWFDCLLVSKKEMESIVDGTGWKVKRFIDAEGPVYIAVMEKER